MNTNNTTSSSGKRLPPEERRAEILKAAKRLLDCNGIQGFSLEAVAREANVAASLPRHYFGSSVELLSAATIDVIKEVEHILRDRGENIPLDMRLSRYLDVIQQYPWGHHTWMRASEIHPSVDTLVKRSRKRIGEAIMGKKWSAMKTQERLQAIGCTGFVEAIVSDWIENNFKNRELVLNTLFDWLAYNARQRLTTAETA